MRTTIRLHDDLHRAVKLRAARTGRTMAQVIEDAVRRELLHVEAQRAPATPLPVFQVELGVLPGVDLADASALRDALDEGASLDALR